MKKIRRVVNQKVIENGWRLLYIIEKVLPE